MSESTPARPAETPEASPGSPHRRAFLRGALGAGAAGAIAGAAGGYAYGTTRPASASEIAPDDAGTGLLPPVPFHGRHQSGILPRPQRQTAVIAFDATPDGRGELVDLFQTITARARFLTAGGLPPPVGIGAPPSDSGVLGPTVVPDGLTVTVGVGSTLFDERYGLAARLPAKLTAMRTFANDDLDPAQCGGDLVVQLSAGNADTVLHALRDIARHTRGGMQARWRIDGFSSPARPAGTAPRNMLGFMGLVMDYFDGNTVTGLWNYAQHYSMSDNNFDTVFGPSTPGALNLISGNSGGSFAVNPTTGAVVPDPGSVSDLNSKGLGTIYGDLDPAYDDCSNNSHTATSPVGITTGKNIGDLLNARNVTWGWFQGGFTPTSTNSAGFAVCGSAHQNIGGATVTDYSAHHEPFQYYKSTANPKHLPPSSEAAIGHTDQANHQYDLSDFYQTLSAGNMPAVSFLKAPAYQDGHAGYSNPIDEQTFLVTAINKIEKSKDWKSTAIVVTYDDSDGWYDHQVMPIVNGSNTSADTPFCSSKPTTLDSWTTRCGYGQRLPMLVISPWTRQNYISSNMTNTVSVTTFIEDNWLRGRRIGGGSFDAISGSLSGKGGLLNFRTRPNFRPVILNPETGEVVSG